LISTEKKGKKEGWGRQMPTNDCGALPEFEALSGIEREREKKGEAALNLAPIARLTLA